jgi:phenylacetate-CoA ligase
MSLGLSKALKDPIKLQRNLHTKSEKYWIKHGERMVFDLFHQMTKQVPAYKDFLAKNDFNPKSVKSIDDFQKIPMINKDNYLRQYPREQLCWGGVFSDRDWVISTTSGSTGEPFYFPRTGLQDEYYAITAELYLRENFKIHQRSTLYIDAFAMGAWIGGLFTYEAVRRVAKRGYPLSIITPGVNKSEVINSVKQLGRDFDQVIIGCYPPILKDIIDLGRQEGLDWSSYNLGIIFSAEGFSEEFRDYIIKYGCLENKYTSTLNHYGTVDLGTMSHETPTTILVRRQAVNDRALFKSLFGDINKQPTLTQYIPEQFYFEEMEGRVICSSNSGLPLVRYDLKDRGGVISLEQLKHAYRYTDRDFENELSQEGIRDTLWNLPLVYIYERSDFSVTFSGAQIYPEEIRRALEVVSLENRTTGKFTMISGYDNQARNYLEINIELMSGVVATNELKKVITEQIVSHLLKENSEYRVLYDEYKSKLHPRIKLWPYQHSGYFHGKGKQEWVKK